MARSWIGGATALAAIVVLSGCGDATTVEIDGDPAEALASAAAEEVGTVRYAIEATIATSSVALGVTADGIVEPDGDSHQTMTTEYELSDTEREELEAAGVLDQLEAATGTMEWISTGGAVYLRSVPEPDPLPPGRRPLPPGVEWVVNDGGPFGSLALDAGNVLEPLQILEQLQAVTQVEDRGVREIDGQPVRWLRAELDEGAAAGGDDRWIAGAVVDVYLDADGRVRRVVRASRSEEGRSRVVVDYLDFHADETVTAPPEETTIRMEELYDRELP